MKIEILTIQELSTQIESLKNEILEYLWQDTKTKKKWLKSKDTMKLLNCSKNTLINLRQSKILPYSKIGGTFYYALEDIELILEENKIGEIKNEKSKN